MTKSCCAYNCTNRFKKNSGIVFHRFPFSNYDLLTKWILAVRRTNFFPTVHTFICSKHFAPECYYKNYPSRHRLKENSVPTLFNFPDRKQKKLRTLMPKPQPPVKNLPPENIIINQPDEHIVKSSSVDHAHTYSAHESPKKIKLEYDVDHAHTYSVHKSPEKIKLEYDVIVEKKNRKIKKKLTTHDLLVSPKLKPEYLANIKKLKEKFCNADVAQTSKANCVLESQ